jgi:Xaa-Pro aminopeptidase
MNYARRVRALLAALETHNLDALLVTHLPNIRYLCGFTGSAGALVLSARGARFFTDGRYTAQAQEEVLGADISVMRKAPFMAAAEWLSRVSLRSRMWRVGVDGEHMTLAEHTRLAKFLPRRIRLKQAPPLVEQARMIKDVDELARLRRAVHVGSSLFDTLLRRIRPGVREIEVAGAIETRARKAGAEAMSFETIIASGKRSAMPHGAASGLPIPARAFVVCDFGVILDGYCSDMTRTVYVGRVPAKARAFYNAVREAQQAALDTVRPGVQVSKVDRAARKVLHNARLERYFTHSTGHGVGLEIHESPRVAAGQQEVLRPGMVITVEPGAYVPGRWGVRIEDMVVVTREGCDVLTPTPKDLIAI